VQTLRPARAPLVIVTAIAIAALLAVIIMMDARRRDVLEQLRRLSVEKGRVQGEEQKDQTKAKEILQRVRRHLVISSDPTPTIAEIVDVETLRAKNAFYTQAQNGDYLIVTRDRAILYSPSRDIILDVMPVQLERKTVPEQ